MPRVHELTPSVPFSPSAFPASLHLASSRETKSRSYVQKADWPTDCRRLFRGAKRAPLRKEKHREYMRGTKQKNGREFVSGGRGTSAGGREETRACARNSYAAREKGGVYRRDRIIGDSLFLLAPCPSFPLSPRSFSIRSTDLSSMFNWLSKATFLLWRSSMYLLPLSRTSYTWSISTYRAFGGISK